MKKLDIGGQRRENIIDYFTNLEQMIDVIDRGTHNMEIQFLGCSVIIEEERTTSMGSVVIPRVNITFEGDLETEGGMVAAFRLNFLSMGG